MECKIIFINLLNQILLELIFSNKQRGSHQMSTNYSRKKIQNYSYGLNDTIGKGYSSQVFKGRNDETQQNVAIKVIDLRMLKNQINKVLLDSQIQVLKELKRQSHIINLHEIFTTKNNTYIVTELCDCDLSKIVKKGISQQQAYNYMQQIIGGYLNFARKQIIHRDLKPANILVTENEELKIADFGFAIKTSDAYKYSKYNVGSPLYMAPQSLKKNEYSQKTDIWALGIIFYELLTGQTPWKAKNQKELIKKIENQKAQDIINKLKISMMARQFLKKSLKIDKVSRMDVQDLASFKFQPIAIQRQNILAQKTVNTIFKKQSKDNRSFSIFSPKITKETSGLINKNEGQNRMNKKDMNELSQRKINTFRQNSPNKGNLAKINHSYNQSVTLELIKRQQSLSKQNPEFISPKPLINKSQDQKKLERKTTSKILISQIHFCRFLYKLVNKIIQSNKDSQLYELESKIELVVKDYIGIIRHKIQNLQAFKTKNFINTKNYQEYKQTNDFNKLMKIATQYKDRYIVQMKSYWNISKCSFSTINTLSLIFSLQRFLQSKENQDNFINTYQKEIIILDYLMTAKQLIDICQNQENYQRFAKKSRIQEIVEGRTASISWDLYAKIVNRSKQLKKVKQANISKTLSKQKKYIFIE